MKTAIEEAIKEIANLWSSPSDVPTYSRIIEILESKKQTEKQQIIDAWNKNPQGYNHNGEQYYTDTYGK